MSSKRVFILGAGFSKQVGMPLATELTPLLCRKFEEYNHDEALEWITWLDERISWMKRKNENVMPALNIEELFDLAYFDALIWKMRQHMCTVSRNSGDTPYSTAKGIEAWLSYMEDDLRDVIWERQKQAQEETGKIDRFSKHLKYDDVIITFNYDTLIENSLSTQNIDWHYGFKQENDVGTGILKMHGSINWLIVPRNKYSNFGYPLLFKKEDANRDETDWPCSEEEWDYVLIRIPDSSVGLKIENRNLQSHEKPYFIGIAGLGRYKPLDRIPGSGQVWHNAGSALYQADEIYIVGFSLSPFDTMARMHFAGVMCERAKKNRPATIVLIDPNAYKLKNDFQSVFGTDTPITIYQQKSEQVKWSEVLGSG